MEQNRAFGIQQPNFHLDSQTALDNIRGARSVTIAPLDIGSPDEVAEPAATPKRQLGLSRSVPAPSEVKQIFIEPFGPAVERAPAPAAEPVAIKPNQPTEEGFFTGVGKALFGGVQDTGGSLYSAGATAVGSNSSVVESSKAAAERQKTEPIELSKFKQNIATRQQAGDDTIWQGIKNVAGAAYDNPEGAFQMLVNQLPNSGVALASGWAGAQGGSALGTLVAPGPGTVFGGIAGFLTGLFAANVSLEVGGKAQEKARDGNFTDAERSEALKEGTTKGAIITGVDALTLGGSKWVLGAANRAVETATVKTLQEAGIDTTKAVAAIKDAQRAALETTAKSGREAATDAMSKATLAVMEREGLTAPELVSRVQGAQKAALESVNNLKNKLGRGATAVGLESAGEGIGEYLGELVATGKASPTEAVLEALTSLPLSIGELNAVVKIDKPGVLTESTNLIGKTDAKKDPLTGETTKQMPFGSSDMTPDLTVLNDRRYMQTASYFDRAIKNNKDDLLNSMAAIYNQVEQSKNDKAASDEQKQQADAMLNVIRGAANRLSLSSQFESKITSATAIASGTEFLSQYPDMRERLIGRMTDIATTMPANTTPKKDNRRQETSSSPLTEEDVMNMPFPDEESTGSSTSTSGKKIDIGGVASAADPVSQMANYIKSISNPEGTAALGGFKEGAVDKYGVVPWVSEDGTKRLFTHNSVPDFVFNSREDAIHAQQALKLANEQMKQRREQRAAEGLNQNQSAPKDDGSSSLDDLDLLYSKDATGVKAVAVPAEKAVYYNAEKLAGMTDKQRSALDLHEIGAHIAMELMLGNKRYEALLSELESMKGKDKMVDEAYASLPVNTNPDLVNTEALGYLVENYENMNIVQKFFQIIKDWYAKNFKGQELTATDLQRLAKEAFAIYEGQIERKVVKPEQLPSDGLFSKEKPTVSDLVKALPNVVKNIIETDKSSFQDMNDLGVIIKRRMKANPQWASLEKNLTPAMVKNAHDQATKSIVETSTDEDSGTFKKVKVKSAEKVANDKIDQIKAKEEPAQEKSEPAKERGFVAQRLSALEQEIRSIVDKYTSASYYNGVIQDVISEIASLEQQIKEKRFTEVTNPDGSVTTFVRRQTQDVSMERQVESTGRMANQDAYYEQTNDTAYDNPDSIRSLEARRRMLELELQNIRARKLSKAAQAGRLGVFKIRMDIDAAIQRAVADGLPIEATIPLGREWIGGLDSVRRASKLDQAEAKAKLSQELKEFYERRDRAIEEANIPEDYDFAFGLAEGILSVDKSGKPKVSVAEAMDLINKAQAAGEIENKKDVYRIVLTGLAETYGNAKDLNIKGVTTYNRIMSDIMTMAMQAKREGLLRFDEFKSVFGAAKVSVPHEILRLSEVAASRRMLDFMAEHGNDPSYRFFWLRSMDRVLRFNPELEQYFTDYEKNHHDEWKAEVSALNTRLSKAGKEGGTGNLLYNRFSLDEMRNPDKLSNNTRTRLQEMYPNLVDAYFGDMLYALRTGRTNIVELKSKLATPEDKKALQDFIDRKNRLEDQQAERLERQDYFKDLSQFTHIDDKSFDRLYNMMKRDSIKNLPMIMDMAEMMEEAALLKSQVPFSFIGNKPESNGATKMDTAAEENESQDFEQLVASAVQKSLMGDRGISDATMRSRRDPIFNFDSYRDGVEGRFVSFEESDGEQNRYGREDESVEDRLMYGEDTELAGLIGDDKLFDDISGQENEDGDQRLRQGQYVGYLNTAVVMNMVNNITKSWTNAPNIVVLQNHLQLPESLRDQVSKKLGKGMGAKGLFDGSTGTIYLFSNFLSSQDDVQFTLFHEAYGHLGLRLMFGQEFDRFLENAYNSNAAVRQDVDAQLKRGGIGKLEAIEETLSEFAGQNKEPSLVKDFIGRIIAGLRRIGLDRVANYIGGFTDAELAYSLKAAKSYAQNFGRSPLIAGPDDIRLSSDKPPYEIFAKKGANTTGYARYDPLTGEYYLFKATGNDIRQGSKMEILKTYDEVVQKMDKLGVLERRVRSGFFRDNKMPSDFVKYLNSQQVGWLQKKMDGIIRSFQNQYLPVFRIVEQMESQNRVTESLDLRKFLRLNERQTAVKVEDFDRNYVQPIMDLIREAEQTKGQYLTSEGATDLYSMLNKFLLAQTAEERNRQVNKRDPESYAGSGMASESSVLADPQKHPEDTAKKVLDFVATQPYAKQFEEIGKKLDAMSRAKVQWEVASGLITKQEGAARDAAYRHYRNLSGINSMLDDDYTGDPSLNIGRKFNLRGKDKYATGRTDEAPDILARTIVGAEAAIIRGQKNLVAQRILAFFETNYDPNFVSINEQSFRRVVDPQTQFIELRENTNYLNQPDVMVVKVNGRVVTIRFKDAGHTSITEAIHGKSEPQSEHPFRQIMRIWGRFAGDMITKYNPFWIPVNFVRDVQTLFLNSGVNGEVGWKMAGQMAKALPSAMYTTLYAALDEMRPHTTKGKKARDFLLSMLTPNQAMLDHYRRGRSQGAFTSFINHKNLEDQIIQINESIGGKSAVGKIEGLLKFWEVMTIPVEMAPRLAAYSTMVKNGRSEIEAADYAGQVTVDFNMRGSNEFVRAAYLFFNPAVQGTAQLFKLAKNNPKQFGIVAGSLMALGFLSTALVRGLDIDGDEDEDKKKNRKERGMSALDEVPDYKRSTSLILMPNQAFGAIPVAYGWNAFFAAGAFLADSVVGNVPASLSFKRTLQAGLEAFSPVGSSGFDFTKAASDPVGQAVALLAPTVAAPMAQWYTNTSRYGGPLYPTNQFNSAVGASDTTKAFSSVNPIARGFAEGLQELTGGDRRNQRGIDLNPALIDHMVQSYMPGIATEMYKGAGVAVRKAQGLDVPREKQPLVDRFSANAQESFDNSAYHRVSQAVHAAWNELDKHPSTDQRYKDILKQHPDLGKMMDVVRASESELRTASSQLKKAEDDAYILRKDGQIERADAMDKANVELRNKTEKAKRLVYTRVVNQAAKSGFKEEIYSD